MSRPIITSLTWIKKNWARPIPMEYEVEENTVQEYNKMKSKAKLTGDETIKESTMKLEQEMDSLNIGMNEVEMENAESIPVFCGEFKEYYQGQNKKSNTDNNLDAENMNLEDYPEDFDDLSDEEQDDFTIHPSDSLIACTTAQEDISNIEIYIYDEKHQSLYVHHDIILSAYPLCVEWLPSRNNIKCNYAIVGSFLPEIEIWNLDVQDALEPEIILGKAEDDDKYFKNIKKKKSAMKNKKAEDLRLIHTDAVLSLNINPFNNGILASAGADGKILFWDINSDNTTRAVKAITEHKDKVQSVRWNKMEDNVLISGSFDKTIKLFDVRAESSCTTIQVASDIECLEWSSVNKYLFLSSYENGRIDLYDIRKFDTLVNFQAHKKAATSVSFSNKQEGLFCSVGSDSHVKIWDAENTTVTSDGVMPSLLCEKFVKKTTGDLFCAKFSDDIDYTIAVGGSQGELFIWQLEENPSFCSRYGIKWEDKKISDEFNNISKKRMMSNRIGFRSDKKQKKKKIY